MSVASPTHAKETRLERTALAAGFLMLFGAGLASARLLSGSWRAVAAPFVGAVPIASLLVVAAMALHRRGVRPREWWLWVSLPLAFGMWGAVWDALDPLAPGLLPRAWLLGSTGVTLKLWSMALARLTRRRSRPAPPAE